MIHEYLYAVESFREHGRIVVECVCFGLRDARRKRKELANEQTPKVRIVRYSREGWNHESHQR